MLDQSSDFKRIYRRFTSSITYSCHIQSSVFTESDFIGSDLIFTFSLIIFISRQPSKSIGYFVSNASAASMVLQVDPKPRTNQIICYNQDHLLECFWELLGQNLAILWFVCWNFMSKHFQTVLRWRLFFIATCTAILGSICGVFGAIFAWHLAVVFNNGGYFHMWKIWHRSSKWQIKFVIIV